MQDFDFVLIRMLESLGHRFLFSFLSLGSLQDVTNFHEACSIVDSASEVSSILPTPANGGMNMCNWGLLGEVGGGQAVMGRRSLGGSNVCMTGGSSTALLHWQSSWWAEFVVATTSDRGFLCLTGGASELLDVRLVLSNTSTLKLLVGSSLLLETWGFLKSTDAVFLDSFVDRFSPVRLWSCFPFPERSSHCRTRSDSGFSCSSVEKEDSLFWSKE